MNIGIFISRLTKSGPVNVIYNLIHETTDISIKYTIFTFRPEILNNTRVSDFEKLHIPVCCVYDKNLIRIWFNIKKEVERHNIDIIHAHCFCTLVFGSYIKRKKIFTVHQNFYFDWKSNDHLKFAGKIMIVMEDILLRRWNIIITCAKFLEEILKKRMPRKNICCVTNGVLINKRCTESIPKNAAKKFIYVGSIDKRKNVKKLCEQFSSYSLDDEVLFCVGTGKDLELIQKMNYSNIQLLGFQNNISELMYQANYFISMSISEGFPLAVIEALSCKLPVILSDIPAHRDLFLLNEKIGVLITDGLENALKKIRKNNYSEMSNAAYITYLEYLSAGRMAQEYIKQYRSLYEK